MEELQADLTSLRKAFNERISYVPHTLCPCVVSTAQLCFQRYFRQLQEISDTVAEAEWEDSVHVTLQQREADKAALEVKINTNRARKRYLEHLGKAQGDGTLEEDEELCILCKCEFTRGYVTQWYVK